MQIEEQIQKLLRLKAKIDLYRKLIAVSEGELSCAWCKELEETFPGLLEEFSQEINTFVNKRIDMLGNPKEVSSAQVTTISNINGLSNASAVVGAPEEEPTDPLRFLKKYKHLDGKRVIVNSPNGKVGAVVQGMVTPFLLVYTDTGHPVQVSPKDITLE